MLTLLTSLLLLTSSVKVVCEIEFIAERLPLQGNRPVAGSPWPQPKTWTRVNETLTFNPDQLTLVTNVSCDLIEHAYSRLSDRLKTISASVGGSSVTPPSTGSRLRVFLQPKNKSCPGYPRHGMAEDYSIFITDNVTISSTEIWGLIWALETLSQLMYMIDGKWYINKGTVLDKPRFSYRGLHLDTARHFYPVDILKKNLDVMAMNKFNVFHWHIVDAQSFPFESKTYPNLTLKGAYTPRLVYRQSDVREIIELARLRGIRVLPEFDTPGHAHSWGKGHPELLTSCYNKGQPDQAVYPRHAERENFDPTKNETFTFLSNFFAEVKSVFVDDFIHMGMDEAHYMCWESSPVIAKFMAELGIPAGNYSGLESYFSQRLLDIMGQMGKRVVIWEDPVNHGANISHSAWVQVWKDSNQALETTPPWQTHLLQAVRLGYDVIFSSCWYLNKIAYGQDWKNFYTCDPYNIADSATAEELNRIRGGEACTWSEYIDEHSLLSVIWPRASAVAERLWSDVTVNDTDDATFRLDQHRCRMVRLGIPAQPILPGYCQDDYNTDNSVTVHVYRPAQEQVLEPTGQCGNSALAVSQSEGVSMLTLSAIFLTRIFCFIG
ncbi:beta-hexosaminidase subunit beta-like [Physella acuta]|uniref:beta-hexosaminidase subunit beta-like n=1 Tax=Physella acuta TaxID=109671 RepID=UPI0027DE0901|nr:beta-hexosaminidase subunit beta-like [Physella acuta]